MHRAAIQVLFQKGLYVIGLLSVFAYACVFILFSGSFVIAREPESLTPEEAVNSALLANPDLSAMKAMALAMAQIPVQKGALPDPQLSIRAANLPVDTFALDQEAMTQMQVAVSQALPFPGKLSLMERVAELESQGADFNYEQKRLLLIQDVKTVWWNLFYLDRALETNRMNQGLFKQLNSIALTKYQVGNGLQQDVLMAQLELSKLLEQEITLTNMRRNEVVRLNIFMDRSTDNEIVLAKTENETIPDIPDTDLLLKEARISSPLIQDMNTRLETAKAKVQLSEKNFYPDFMVGATYGYREGENPDGSDRADFATFSFTMSVPLFNQAAKRSAVSQHRQEVLQQSQSLRNTENNVEALVATALSDLEKTSKELTLLKSGIIPQARQTVDSMMAGYQVNKVDFLNLIRAQTALYDYETRYWKSFSSANQVLARLAAAIGKEKIGE